MKFKQFILARWLALASCCWLALAAQPASAQIGSGGALAPNIDSGAIASAKGPASSPQDAILSKVRWDQKQGNAIPLDATFKDESGRSVTLGQFFHGDKPVVLSMIFFNCTMLCSEVMNGSLELFKDQQKQLGFKLGRDYEAVTISINPNEGPDLAAGKKKTYLSQLKTQPDAAQGWHLLTGQNPQIKAVADSVGYRYTYDPNQDQYAHPGGIVILTPDGHVSRYFPGVAFDERDVRLALIEASHNKIGTPIEKLALFTCFHYNPTTGKYSLALMKVIQIAGLMTVLGIGTGIWAMRRVENKLQKRVARGTASGEAPAAAST